MWLDKDDEIVLKKSDAPPFIGTKNCTGVLRKIMQDRGITQKYFHDNLDIPFSDLSHSFSNRRKFSYPRLFKIAKFLDISLDTLLYYEVRDA